MTPVRRELCTVTQYWPKAPFGGGVWVRIRGSRVQARLLDSSFRTKQNGARDVDWFQVKAVAGRQSFCATERSKRRPQGDRHYGDARPSRVLRGWLHVICGAAH